MSKDDPSMKMPYLQKTGMMNLMYINWIFKYGALWFLFTTNFSVTVLVNESEIQVLFCYGEFVMFVI